jgi:hypothetical protein
MVNGQTSQCDNLVWLELDHVLAQVSTRPGVPAEGTASSMSCLRAFHAEAPEERWTRAFVPTHVLFVVLAQGLLLVRFGPADLALRQLWMNLPDDDNRREKETDQVWCAFVTLSTNVGLMEALPSCSLMGKDELGNRKDVQLNWMVARRGPVPP